MTLEFSLVKSYHFSPLYKYLFSKKVENISVNFFLLFWFFVRICSTHDNIISMGWCDQNFVSYEIKQISIVLF